MINGSACITCDPSCSQCTGTAANECTSCYSGKYLKVDDNTCTACTSPGYYIVSTTQTCEACDASCKTCSGSTATDCLSCYTGQYLLAANSSCVSCNVDGYYQDTETQTCKACDTSCQTCSGSAATNCLSCPTGKYLLASNNSCVSCNVDGYYQDTLTQTCEACDTSCQTCSESSATSCLSCYSGKYMLAVNNSCVSCNINGYYQDTVTQTCEACDTSCKTCSGSASTNCLSCDTGKYLLAANNSCVSCDVDGYYQDTLAQTCNECDTSCQTCSGSAATNCLSCPTGKYLLASNNSCVSCDVDGYYQDTVAQSCNTCDLSCQTCNGAVATNCLSCDTGRYLLAANNSCVSCDVDGYYQDTLAQTCEACDTSCQTCSGSAATNCLSCPTGKYLLASNNSCVSCDVDGYYLDSATQTCNICDPDCETCSGSSATNCLSCYTGKYLLTANNSCVSCNVNGYYQDISTQTCKTCDTTCQTCSGASDTNCLSCYSGKYLLVSNKSCVSCDVDGYYQDTSTQTCKVCNPSCQTCNGAAATSCLSCYAGKYLFTANNSCVSCTGDGVYLDSGTQTCKLCDASCKTCNGPSPTSCLSCYSGKYFLDNSCVSCDVDGYYQDTDTQTCKSCDASCKTCNGPSPTNCLSCYSGKQLNQSNSCVNKTTSASKEYPHLTVTLSNTASTTQAALQVQSATTSLLPVLIRGATTTAVLMVNFVSDVLLFRYINVPFPGNFVDFCKNLYTNFLPNFYATFEEEYNIPDGSGKFGEFEMSTVILGNCGNTLDREFIALSLIFTLIFMAWVTKKFPRVHSVFKTLRDMYKWNIFLTFFIGDFGELYLFSMLQIKEDRSQAWYAWYGYFISIAFLASYPLLIGYFIYLLNRKAASKVSDEVKLEKQPTLWREVPKSVNMISTDFKKDHWLTRNFLLVLLVENFFNDLHYLFLQNYGSFQAVLYTGTTLVFLLLGLIYRPYTSKLQNMLFGLNYTFKFVLGILAIYIGLTQTTASDNKSDSLGLALIVVIVTAISCNAIIVVGILLSSILQTCRGRLKKKSQVLPLKIIESPTNIVKLSPLKIDNLEAPSTDPFQLFSQEFKSIVGTPYSGTGGETPTMTILASSGRTQRKKGQSSTRLISMNLDFNESGEMTNCSRFRVGNQDFSKATENLQRNNDTSINEKEESFESQYKPTSIKIRSRQQLPGSKIIRYDFDE